MFLRGRSRSSANHAVNTLSNPLLRAASADCGPPSRPACNEDLPVLGPTASQSTRIATDTGTGTSTGTGAGTSTGTGTGTGTGAVAGAGTGTGGSAGPCRRHGMGSDDSLHPGLCELPQQQRMSPGLAPPLSPTMSAWTPTPALSSASWWEGDMEPAIIRSRSETHLQILRSVVQNVSSTRSQAQHYEVERFRRLRSLFGISAAAYARAFPDDLSTLGSTWRQRLKESVSEGKSGSFFYRVANPASAADGGSERLTSLFIVKQISRREKETLMASLPQYEAYVQRREGRSFVQYLGCHSMSLRWALSGKVYFVVMRNFVPVRPWLVFDLKGATANRRSLATHRLHELVGQSTDTVRPCARVLGPSTVLTNGGVMRGSMSGSAGGGSSVRDSCSDTASVLGGSGSSPLPSSYPTLRDWEWMDIAMAVDVSEQDKLLIADTIASDATFLAGEDLLDYSLLVGIHRLPTHLTGGARDSQLEMLRRAGGYISVERQKVYFFGIIDVLERSSLRWQLQRLALTCGYHMLLRGPGARGISALPPLEYAERFCVFALHEALQLTLNSARPLACKSSTEGNEEECVPASVSNGGGTRQFGTVCWTFA